MYPIVSMIITYDSTLAVTVTKKSDSCFFVKMYSLETYELKFEEEFSGSFIRAKEVEQSPSGKNFALSFFEDGVFKLRVFTSENRDPATAKKQELNLNQVAGINDHTMTFYGFPDPYVVCTFLDEKRVFVAFFHAPSNTHYHLIYNSETKAVEGGHH